MLSGPDSSEHSEAAVSVLRLVAIPVVVVLSACRPDPEPPEVVPPPLPVILPECASDTGAVLTVRFMDRYVLREGGVEQAAGDPPVVWTRVDGRYTSSQGQAVEPGVRVFENMPREPLLVCLGAQCVSTCQRDVDLGRLYFGRPFPGWNLYWQEGQSMKGVELTLTQLEPWRRSVPPGAYDLLRIIVPNVRYTAPVATALPAGATTASIRLHSASPDLSQTLSVIPTISAAAGDALLVQQQRSYSLDVTWEEGTTATFGYWTAVRAGEVRHYPDSYSTMELALQAPPVASVSFRIDEPSVAQLISAMGMDLRPPVLRSEVLAARRAGAALTLQRNLPLLSAAGSQGAVPGMLTFSYGLTGDEPAQVLEVQASASSEDSHLYLPSVGWRRELAEGVSQVLQPEINQVDDLRIGKRSGGDLLVSWSAPTLGVAHQYEVLFFNDDNRNSIPRRVLRVVTTELGVRIPEEWLPGTASSSFRFIVRSVHRSGASPGESPLDESAPGSWADRLSELVPRD